MPSLAGRIDSAAQRLNAALMPCPDRGKPSRLRPAAIPIHDDRDMVRARRTAA